MRGIQHTGTLRAAAAAAIAAILLTAPPTYAVTDETLPCPADTGIMATGILQSTLSIGDGEHMVNGFTIVVAGEQYIVTTKRAVGNDNDVPTELSINNGAGERVAVQLVGTSSGPDGVMVLQSNRVLPVMEGGAQGPAKIAVGQAVRILTFLPGVQTAPLPGGTGRRPPLVMDGILSGVSERGPYAEATMWVQAPPVPGVEGAPVLYQATKAKNAHACGWRLGGVVLAHLHSRINIREQPVGRSNGVLTLRTGLLKVFPINPVVSIVENALSAPQPRSDQGPKDDGVEIRKAPAKSTTQDPINEIRT